MACCDAATLPAGWRAELRLEFLQRDSGTFLARRRHSGPLTVQRPFYPEGGDCCHLYIIHPPGGVVGGDQLTLDVSAGSGSHALLTTPAAGKFYRSDDREAVQEQRLGIADGALLEWLPQETIVFNGARVQSLTRIDLEGRARFFGWEVVCLGRPAAGERFRHGYWRQRLELWREGRPLFLERGRLQGEGAEMDATWGLQGQPVFGTLVATGDFRAQLEQLREALPLEEGFAITQLPEVLACRYLGADAQRAREGFVAAWRILRPLLAGRPACPPRIWNT